MLPFEVLSVLLLAALIGAIVLSPGPAAGAVDADAALVAVVLSALLFGIGVYGVWRGATRSSC